jgi:hypothetical protein
VSESRTITRVRVRSSRILRIDASISSTSSTKSST